MSIPSQGGRRLSAGVLAGLTGAALVGATALPASSQPDEPEYLGSAADFGITPPTVDLDNVKLDESALKGRWFVQVTGNPQVKGGSAAAARGAQDAVVRAAKAEGIDLKVTANYSRGWNGMTVTMDDKFVEALTSVTGVAGVYPVLEVERPADVDAEPAMAYAVAMTGADYAQTEFGFTGEGIKVGIIDTGIDYNHLDLGGEGVNVETADFPNDRVAWGYDFVGDDYDASGEFGSPVPVPDEWPDDVNGHGTHVAGIVGANGDIVGVAPGVQFGAYRVFGAEGSSDTDVIMAAMERAHADGMDVVNMSLGASFMTWPSYPTAQAADSFVEAGQVYTVSAGNEGTSGTFSGGAPGVAHNVITVASVDNEYYLASFFETAGGLKVPYSPATGAPEPPTERTMTLVSAGEPGSDAARACPPEGEDPPALGDLYPLPPAGDNQALLVERGDCTFHTKAWTAQVAGYDAVVLYNNTDGVINATVAGTPEITIPVVTILQEDGLALQDEIAADDSTEITWTDAQDTFENPTAGLVSDFSSYGLAADLTLKPDVTAPGGSINSTYPIEAGGSATISGTSMAAPHVAGAAALLLQAHPALDPFEVRTALQNTADQLDWPLVPGYGYLEPVHRQGAGLIDIPQAITSHTTVAPSKISLGEGEGGSVTTNLSITNESSETVTYELGADLGIATGGGTTDYGFYLSDARVSFSSDTVTVRPGRTAKVKATITDVDNWDGMIYGGWITVSSPTEDLVVPFGGMSGDYQALPVLTESPAIPGLPLPQLVDVFEGSIYLHDPAWAYTMQGDDVPFVLLHLEYPVSELAINIYTANPDGTKGEPIHASLNNAVTYFDEGRDPSYFVLAWDGTYEANRGKGNDWYKIAPDGDYVLEIEVLKALGQPSKPGHVETWASPAFTIDRDGDGNIPAPTKGNGKKP